MIKLNTSAAPFSLPESLRQLETIAYNLWWSWNHEAQELFAAIDRQMWEQEHNPVKLLKSLSPEQLNALAANPEFVARVERVAALLHQDLERETWMDRQHPDYKNNLVAYLCTEFGIHECLPIYSGGLGVLAGDHTKSASDLGIPFVGVGLLYRNGYFTQHIDAEGRQVHIYPDFDFTEMPLRRILDDSGKPVEVIVTLPQGDVRVQAWLLEVGRSQVILLDTFHDGNPPELREITSQLYGGDRDMRISQEIVLGFGGVRMLRRLGVNPTVWHLNEGHVAFSCFERIREYMQDRELSFDAAQEAVKSATVFTTHTPVPAGNEAFSLLQMDRYFRDFCKQLGIGLRSLLQLGLQTDENGSKYFSMTVLALRLSCKSNGVSQLHGKVSQRMWAHVWPGVPVEENPITSITNGVHTQTWIAPEMRRLFDEYLGQDWLNHLADAAYWNHVRKVPVETLTATKRLLKQKMIAFIRERLKAQYRRHGADEAFLRQIDGWLSPDALTIGFARRFAPYKRAYLILSDLERLNHLVNHPEHPLQIIFAGKAHPQNKEGQKIIQQIWQLAQKPEFLGKIILLENYDMNVARHMVSGVDVWLNNPRRPQEASGTSGQKAPINGGINFSVLDGWWPEAYDGSNGWKIGEDREYENESVQDREDAESLYSTLEKEIIPLYYGQSHESRGRVWTDIMYDSMRTVIPVFNTEVMVRNYFEKLYRVAVERYRAWVEKDVRTVAELTKFRRLLEDNWPLLHFASLSAERNALNGESEVNITADLYLGELSESMVQVELVGMPLNQDARPLLVVPIERSEKVAPNLVRYHLHTRLPVSREDELRLRVIPKHDALSHKHELGLIYWYNIQ